MARVKTIDFGLGTPYAGTLPTIGAWKSFNIILAHCENTANSSFTLGLLSMGHGKFKLNKAPPILIVNSQVCMLYVLVSLGLTVLV